MDLISTVEQLPAGYIVEEMFGLVFYQDMLQINNRGWIVRLTTGKGKTLDDILLGFKNEAREISDKQANGIIGAHFSTATMAFNNGTFLYYTCVGTAVRFAKEETMT